MREALETDYLVVGAGAAGMAFTDALVDHVDDADVMLVDRRYAAGGHWLDAYPFVRLHQASVFYGVASTQLGDGSLQHEGPETGLHERALSAEICTYYARALDRLTATRRVRFLGGHVHDGDGVVRSVLTGERRDVDVRRAVVDAHYLQAEVPATTPPPFGVAETATVVPVNALVSLGGTPKRFVVVGSGKTATDACVWLLGQGVDPDAICWVRPREPWMLNRAVVQPDPAIFLGMAADTFEAAAESESTDEMFLRMEAAGVMLRIDPQVRPTMARTPTLAAWELELLRSIEDVVRLGRVQHVERRRMVLDRGEVALPASTVVVHCAAAGIRDAAPLPIWDARTITLQPTRAGFPCFGAALTGYVEATREDPEEKNRLCPSSPYGNSLADWSRMQLLGALAGVSFAAEPDVRRWANDCVLNPARIPRERRTEPAVVSALDRLGHSGERALGALSRYAGVS